MLHILLELMLVTPQAESELSEKPKREELDAVINEARSQVLKALNLPTSITDSDPRLQDLDPTFQVRLKAQSKQLLIDEELLRRKLVPFFPIVMVYPPLKLQGHKNEPCERRFRSTKEGRGSCPEEEKGGG